MQNRIGLIAGNGKFPLLLAQEARKKNVEIVAIGIKEETSKELTGLVNKIYWLSVGELEKLVSILIKEKLTTCVMAGQVRHKLLFDNSIKIDNKMTEVLANVVDKKTDSLIGAVAKKLEQTGIKLLDSTTFLADYIPKKGLLTKKALDDRVLKDIEFGRTIAKAIAGLDIGQTVVVKDRVVLAIESIEGTDEAIKRGAFYGKEGVVVVKVSKPEQDMRFDVPIIGIDTIKLLGDLKASCIAIEAGKTLIIDKEEALRLSDSLGIGVIAL